ncbi:preprotein translocase subunit SecG [Candidatus Bartonella washoeensis]|uniref:Protein-export membrane protein SecG n=1 Tax=Cardidatus Bartonella washoeensis 085-0475 TaxID=1094564 RepID=J0QRF4_9HYPH|nr:preprotein translocase subunit SecG [Bartonella washoeensis]EJF85644.1 preprotein translocase, SecG subunit [Bartonella washoeensis 085-0475]
MQTVLIVIHFLVVITLVGIILIQPSEGGGLGVSSGSGLMRTRGSKNALSRLTAILACCFFAVCIGLTVVGNISNSSSDILKRIPVNSEQHPANKSTSESIPSLDDGSQPSILEQLGGVPVPTQEQSKPAVPATESPVPALLENPVPDNGTK